MSLSSAPVAPSPSISLQSIHSSQEQNLKAAYVDECNGQEANANFRSVPSLSPAVVLGVVPKGDFVYLTNQTAFSDGVNWYEAIAPHELRQNNNLSAANQDTRAGQTGWIAACFVRE